MSARTKRAVRVGPGTTSDRRDTVVQGPSTTNDMPYSRVFDGSRRLGERSRNREEQLKVVGLAGGQSSATAGLALQPSSPPERFPEMGAIKLHGQGIGLRISVRDPFHLLHELEHHRGTFEILLPLYREGSGTASEMRRRLRSGQEALDASLDGLYRLGLVNIDPVRGFPFTKTYRLTDRGRMLIETPMSSWFRILVE